MCFYQNGFFLFCKVKELKCSLKELGNPNTTVKDLIRQHLH